MKMAGNGGLIMNGSECRRTIKLIGNDWEQKGNDGERWGWMITGEG